MLTGIPGLAFVSLREGVKLLQELQRHINYQFMQVKLLHVALTHSSYVNENHNSGEHNERLEFLGDAVLELSISQILYERHLEAHEGELTAMRSSLVSQPALANLARKLNIDAVLLLGKGEEKQGGRQRDALLSDAMEAVFGAVFLDGGYDAVKQCIESFIGEFWKEAEPSVATKNSKSRLQELMQKLYQQKPVYTLAGSSGPEHDKIFEIKLVLPDGQTFFASGSSLKKAEKAAALTALKNLDQK